jgi:hypothetical protein
VFPNRGQTYLDSGHPSPMARLERAVGSVAWPALGECFPTVYSGASGYPTRRPLYSDDGEPPSIHAVSGGPSRRVTGMWATSIGLGRSIPARCLVTRCRSWGHCPSGSGCQRRSSPSGALVLDGSSRQNDWPKSSDGRSDRRHPHCRESSRVAAKGTRTVGSKTRAWLGPKMIL